MNKTKLIIDDTWQCTTYAYYRALELNGAYPCWYRGCGDDGSGKFTNAKLWGKHYRTPYTYIELKDVTEYLTGDILVFDGKYGHVVVVEGVLPNGNLRVSDCNRIAPHKFDETIWNPKLIYMNGKPLNTGKLIGLLRIKTERSNEDIAKEVIEGKWGNYPERKKRLTEAGYNYHDIQTIVNKMMYKL